MATFTVTTAQNIDELTGKAGLDIYNINGGTLTIDQDSRYGLNQTTSTSIDRFVISATLGGTVRIDARKVRLIPFNTETGNVPASNTVISQGGASAKLIGVYASLTVAPTASGSAMPTSGFIKVKQWNDVSYAAGALTGISASSTGVDTAGWIEILTEEGTTAQPALAATVPRLGLFECLGEWYSLGTTNGSPNQTFQAPTNGVGCYIPGIFIEKTVGSNDYEFYANAATTTAIAADIRAKVCWVTPATGIIRLGHNGTANAGYTPVTNLKVVIPNIITSHCTSAAKTANVIPNATLTSRWEVGLSSGTGGVYNFDKVNIAWSMNLTQCYQVNISNCGVFDTILVSEIASPMTWNKVGVGQSAAVSQIGLTVNYCFAGGTFTDVFITRAALATAVYIISMTDDDGFTFNNCRAMVLAVKANAGAGSWGCIRVNNTTWNSPKIIGAKAYMATCTNVTWNNTSYCDVPTGITATTAAQNNSVWEIASNTTNATFSGLDFFGLVNVQPFLQLLSVLAAGCSNIKLRNIGTSPSDSLSLGATATIYTGYLFNLASSASVNGLKVQRCFVFNTRTNLYTMDNSSKNIILENVAGDFSDVPNPTALNLVQKSVAYNMSLSAQSAIYGTHFCVSYLSASTRVIFFMNEPTAQTASQVTLSGGAAFTSAGGLYMPTIGQSATFEMPFFALGTANFENGVSVMAGGTIANYRFNYEIDINNGSGYSVVSGDLTAAQMGTALSAYTINPALGFKLRVKIKTTTTNSTAITNYFIPLLTTSAAIQANYYPLDTNTLSFIGLQVGTDVIILSAGTSTILYSKDSISGTTESYTYSGAQSVDIGFIKQGYVPLYIRNLALTTTDSSLPIAQVVDRNYI